LVIGLLVIESISKSKHTTADAKSKRTIAFIGRDISWKMPFASGDAHSAAAMRSEASLDAEASALFGGLSERSRPLLNASV